MRIEAQRIEYSEEQYRLYLTYDISDVIETYERIRHETKHPKWAGLPDPIRKQFIWDWQSKVINTVDQPYDEEYYRDNRELIDKVDNLYEENSRKQIEMRQQSSRKLFEAYYSHQLELLYNFQYRSSHEVEGDWNAYADLEPEVRTTLCDRFKIYANQWLDNLDLQELTENIRKELEGK